MNGDRTFCYSFDERKLNERIQRNLFLCCFRCVRSPSILERRGSLCDDPCLYRLGTSHLQGTIKLDSPVKYSSSNSFSLNHLPPSLCKSKPFLLLNTTSFLVLSTINGRCTVPSYALGLSRSLTSSGPAIPTTSSPLLLTSYVFLLFSFAPLNTNCSFQNELQCIFDCARDFNLEVTIPDTDLALIQECVTLSTDYPDLSLLWIDAIAYVCAVMDGRQRRWFAFERLHPRAMEAAIFGGTEDDPIVILDDADFA